MFYFIVSIHCAECWPDLFLKLCLDKISDHFSIWSKKLRTEAADRRPLFLALLVLTARIIYLPLPHKVFNAVVNKHIAFLFQFFTDKYRLILSLETWNENSIQHHTMFHLITPSVLISFLSWSAATFLSVCIMQFITKHTTSSTVCILKPSESFCSVCGFVLYMGFLIKRACLRVR